MLAAGGPVSICQPPAQGPPLVAGFFVFTRLAHWLHSAISGEGNEMDRERDKLPNTASSLMVIAMQLLGSGHEVMARMQCSESDFRAYCSGEKEPKPLEFDRLVSAIVEEQEKVIAKNRALLDEMRAKKKPAES
jgi:hypothetical protein